MLIRRHVAKLLADYYAQPANRVVGSALLTEGDINFKRLWGEWHYRRVCSRLYANQEGRWLTSVELMRPFYSRVLGNFVAEQAEASLKDSHDCFDIVEMGGGRATNATIILTHLQRSHPGIYQRINSYTMIDASPSLLELQEQTMRSTDHADKMKFELKDIIDVAEGTTSFLNPSNTPTVCISCELLDNLPHDKVRVKGGRLVEQGNILPLSEDGDNAGSDGHEMQQTSTVPLVEAFAPLSDPLLSSILKLAPEYTRTSVLTWIPTVACGVLHRLHQERPNSTLMFADFDWLPPPDLTKEQGLAKRTSTWAAGEPIVTDMDGLDHSCYLESPDHCDILFPTNFDHLAKFVHKSWNISNNAPFQVDVYKQSDFLERFGPEQVDATKSWLTGFTPMLHDFSNCSALTVTRRQTSNGEGTNKGKRNPNV
ncbi:Conserved hypothetical protein [Seminavis robusta]|uniref:Protein arginine methyltransferase NDUFAF7 n=1 Tax=Seminavis robusta TaxID=568900 RepID=A0A9N8DF35_9STRA|nr:Conserved hypothetical protein [Seminavis robusta]|eukprot:Sro59_g034080.1 Conserved hypothetical protein (426) ;mRNA; f:33947-35446